MSSNEPTPALPADDTTPPVVEIEDDVIEDDLTDDELALYREHLRAVAGPIHEPAVASLALRIGAEALGTFALVLVTIAIALYNPFSGVGTLGTALGAGLVLIGATAALGRVSGGHFNPAVTLGATLGGRLPWLELPAYWLAQVVGGVVAGALLFLTIPTTFPGALGLTTTRELMGTAANGWAEHSPLFALTQGQITFDLKSALMVELFAAIVLVAVFLGVTHRVRHDGAPLAIGVTYTALLLVTAPVTGGSLNPARSAAAALFAESSAAGQLWLFWVAPLVGAALAGLGYVAFARPSREDQELAEFMAAELDEVDEDEAVEAVIVTTR